MGRFERPLRSYWYRPRLRGIEWRIRGSIDQGGPTSGAFWESNLRRFGGGGATKATTRRFDRTLAPAAARERTRAPSVERLARKRAAEARVTHVVDAREVRAF